MAKRRTNQEWQALFEQYPPSGRIDNWTPHTLVDKLTCIRLVNGVSYEKYYCGR